MPDFMSIETRERSGRKGGTDIFPVFLIKRTKDLMIRGRDFYAVWLEDEGRWSTDEQDAVDIIDATVEKWIRENPTAFDPPAHPQYASVNKTRVMDDFHSYCQRQMRDTFHPLDETLVFANSKPKKTDYSSKRLPYVLKEGSTEAWDKLFSTLYNPEELHKLEWSIGAIVTGASKTLQKFVVLYGSQGSGKGTFLKCVSDVLFPGYTQAFAAQLLGQSSNQFPLQDLKDNPLVAIDADGKLNKIEDNTRLNTLVSHEKMSVNLKGKQSYEQAFKTFMYVGSNEPVKITNAKSGLLRRLIDVHPSGRKVPKAEYNQLMNQIQFEAGAIAWKCKEIFEEDPNFYDAYVPEDMMSATNDFYQFIVYRSLQFEQENGTTLKAAWDAYNEFCNYAKVQYPFGLRAFKEELKNYFAEFNDRFTLADGTRIRNYYSGFLKDKFENKNRTETTKIEKQVETPDWLIFKEQESLFDKEFADCPAQYAEILDDGTDKPAWTWDGCKVKLSMIDTHKLHYTKIPIAAIVPDFDIVGPDGKKNFELNKKAVLESGLPPTYAELSKSGAGIHLCYYYDGDPNDLSATFGDHIEIKVFTGNASLRRKLTKCNNLPIAHISSGLPLKGASNKTVTKKDIENSKHLRALIGMALKRQLKDGDPESNHTKTNIDFIGHVLKEAQEQGVSYDVNDLMPAVLKFAAGSTNNSSYCLKEVRKMKFRWPDVPPDTPDYEPEPEADAGISMDQRPIAFFDVEVFPNLFIVCWKELGADKPIHRMINPKAIEVEMLYTKYALIGFNNRKYDNHIIWAASQGYSPEQLFHLSKTIIGDKQRGRDALFRSAYSLSKTDLYDLSRVKQSLKKFEIELAKDGVPHKELGMDWNEPVPEEMWETVAAYCDNDVKATEAVYEALLDNDIVAREILADIAGMTMNDTTNQLTTKIVFGTNRTPQGKFNYRNLALPVTPEEYELRT